VYYYLTEEKYEIDFLTEDILGNRKLYQLVWDVQDEKTMEREMRALQSGMRELNIPGELITPDVYFKNIWSTLCPQSL